MISGFDKLKPARLTPETQKRLNERLKSLENRPSWPDLKPLRPRSAK